MRRSLPGALVSHLVYLLKGVWDSDRKLLLSMVLEALCVITTPYVAIHLPRVGVDLVARHAGVPEVLFEVGVLAAMMLAAQAAGSFAHRGRQAPLNRLRDYFRKKLFLKTLDCDYTHVESAEWQDRYTQASTMSVNWGPWSATTLMSEGAVAIAGSIVSFTLYGIIIATFNGWILLMIALLSLANFIAMRKAHQYECDRLAERNGIQRRRWYVYRQADDPQLGKDVRLYAMVGWIDSIARHYQRLHYLLRRDVNDRYYHAGIVDAVTLLIRDGVAYALLIAAAAAGRIDSGSFVLLCGAVASFSGLMSTVNEAASQMIQAVAPLSRMRDYLDAADDPDPESPAEIPPRGTAISVEFRDVSFAYVPGKPVLDHLNLWVDAGQKLALVGVNGAGKTTMVKLICGFYKPQSGEVLINGVPTSRYRRNDLYGLVSTVFQETTVFPFSVAQNVSLALEEHTDKARARESLARSGLLEDILAYPQGLDTQMMKVTDERGISLSGGQQQKLLMARALYKDAPLFIFDEPTAALDAIAESETYEQFNALSGGKTTLYISHRLASTRFCDRIAFLEDGRVAALGSHTELLRTCPHYADMFEKQSRYYQKEAVDA